MTHEKTKDISQYVYRASAVDFMKIPGSPILYSLGDSLRKAFEQGDLISAWIDFRAGLLTGDNEKFQRHWHEIGISDFATPTKTQAINPKKWFPCHSGGPFRKWYGNHEIVVNWAKEGLEIKSFKDGNGKLKSRPQNAQFFFREGITYPKISSGSFSARYRPPGFVFDDTGRSAFGKSGQEEKMALAFLCSNMANKLLELLCPTLSINTYELEKLPFDYEKLKELPLPFDQLIETSKNDWDLQEISWDFHELSLIAIAHNSTTKKNYQKLCAIWCQTTLKMQDLERENNRLFIEAYGLQDELIPEVPLDEITLTCNPHYRYGGNLSDQEREKRMQSDTLAELVSYAVGCMMGRYSLDKLGLILASQGETLQDYLSQIPSPRFLPDEDAILPITDQEWLPDDAINRFREFIGVTWGKEHLEENLNFVAESLCLHAIKPKKSESGLETIRRYLSTQYYKDHLRTYKKRPIYWLFSSGKHKAFECLVYLHRYNEGTLSRIRMEYVVPLQSRFQARIEDLDNSLAGDLSTSERKRLQKELDLMRRKLDELRRFDEKLRHYADQRIQLDLDDGVKVNYGKFGDLLADVKAITGQ